MIAAGRISKDDDDPMQDANDREVPEGLRNISSMQMLRIRELSRAAGVDGVDQPCFGVLDFPDMKYKLTHPAEDELARIMDGAHTSEQYLELARGEVINCRDALKTIDELPNRSNELPNRSNKLRNRHRLGASGEHPFRAVW